MLLADDRGTGKCPSLAAEAAAGDQEPRQAGERLCASARGTGTGDAHNVTKADRRRRDRRVTGGSWHEGSQAAATYLSSGDGQEGAHDRQHFAAVRVSHVPFLGQEEKATWILITERTQMCHDTLFQEGHFQAFVLKFLKES